MNVADGYNAESFYTVNAGMVVSEQYRITQPLLLDSIWSLAAPGVAKGYYKQVPHPNMDGTIGVSFVRQGTVSTIYYRTNGDAPRIVDPSFAEMLDFASTSYLPLQRAKLLANLRTQRSLRLVAPAGLVNKGIASKEANRPQTLQVPNHLRTHILRYVEAIGASRVNSYIGYNSRILFGDDQESDSWLEFVAPNDSNESEGLTEQISPEARELWTEISQVKGWRPATDEELRPRVRIIR